MKRILTFLALAASLSLQAQSVLKSNRELLLEDMDRAGVTMHHYEALDTTDTPAPKGFKPFYISHIGRHGSRYQTSADKYNSALERLQPYKDEGQLTADGLWLYNAIDATRAASEGKYGKLTPIGALEHREIARRISFRFPEVWDQPGRKRVVTYSTTSGRVLESRKNFLKVLKANYPALEVEEYNSKDEYNGVPVKEIVAGRKLTAEEKEALKATKRKITYPENPYEPSWRRLAEKTFTVPEKVSDHRVKTVVGAAFSALLATQCMSEDLPSVKEYFTPEEAYAIWFKSNVSRYASDWSINTDNKGLGSKKVVPIMKHWIADADEAVKGGDKAADLRFSHDVYVQPLLALIGATGNDVITTPEEIGDRFCSFTSICMATNIQMIFYKAPKDKRILVKILHNEREVIIPSLKTTENVYHEWKDLRKYLEERIDKVENSNF